MKEREEFLLGEENTSPAARTLFVSLDRADAIIEGAPGVGFMPGSLFYFHGWSAPSCIRRGSTRQPSPFAAPNSRSPPKFDHSLLFTLLLNYPRATSPPSRLK